MAFLDFGLTLADILKGKRAATAIPVTKVMAQLFL